MSEFPVPRIGEGGGGEQLLPLRGVSVERVPRGEKLSRGEPTEKPPRSNCLIRCRTRVRRRDAPDLDPVEADDGVVEMVGIVLLPTGALPVLLLLLLLSPSSKFDAATSLPLP